MNVIDGLPGILPDIDEHAETGVGDSPIRRHLGGCLEQLGRKPPVIGDKGGKVRKMGSRDHEHVRWSLRGNVVERDNVFRFIQEDGAELSSGNRAEDAIIIALGHGMGLSPSVASRC